MGQSSTKEKAIVRDRIIVTGMPDSGETTLLYWLKNGEVDSLDLESIYPAKHSSQYKGLEVFNPGLGGRNAWRPKVNSFLRSALGIVYLVDSTDNVNWPWKLATCQLQIMLEEDKGLKDAVIAVGANKQDLPGAKSLEEIQELLTIDLDGEKRRFKVFPMVANKGEGVSECFDWVAAQIKEKQTITAAVEPWKEVAGELTKDGKTGLKLVKKNWKKFTSVLSQRCAANSA